MCGCDFNFVCSMCERSRLDWRWWHDDDPAERERDQRDAARIEEFAGEDGITRPQRSTGNRGH